MTEQNPPSRDVPPGSPPPGAPAPQWPPYAAGGAAVPRPLHKPGTVPLRPLTLGDFFEASFTTIRRNPRQTIGMGALVTAAFLAVPIVGTIALGLAGQVGDLDLTATDSNPSFTNAGILISSVVTSVFGLLANVVVAGLIVPVVTRSAVGERVTTGEAWRRVKGRLPRLLGLSLLELLVIVLVLAVPAGLGLAVGLGAGSTVAAVLLVVLGLLVGLVGALAVHVRWFQLAAPVLVVERRGVWASLARSRRLGEQQFWRILGIFLLTWLLTVVVNQVISLPFSILGFVLAVALPDGAGTVALLLSGHAASILSGAVLAPFTGAVAVLQYLDQRFRKEGFDIELLTYVQSRRDARQSPGQE